MTVSHYEDIAEVLTGLATSLSSDGAQVPPTVNPMSTGSAFGHGRPGTVELTNFSFVLAHPLKCVLVRPEAPVNEGYLLGNLLLTLAGSNKVNEYEYYNNRAADFSSDGATLAGAWGPKLFGDQHGTRFDAALVKLQRDPTTRQAYIPLFDPSDLLEDRRDVSCAVGLHFMIRDRHLHLTVNMRSQSAFGVLPYDLPLFVAVQSLMATELGVPIGHYVHLANSLHYYGDENEKHALALNRSQKFEPMPPLPDRSQLAPLLEYEASLRSFGHHLSPKTAQELGDECLAKSPSDFSRWAVQVLLEHAVTPPADQ